MDDEPMTPLERRRAIRDTRPLSRSTQRRRAITPPAMRLSYWKDKDPTWVDITVVEGVPRWRNYHVYNSEWACVIPAEAAARGATVPPAGAIVNLLDVRSMRALVEGEDEDEYMLEMATTPGVFHIVSRPRYNQSFRVALIDLAEV